MIDHDVLIIGGGLAGTRAAVEVARTNPGLSIGLIVSVLNFSRSRVEIFETLTARDSIFIL